MPRRRKRFLRKEPAQTRFEALVMFFIVIEIVVLLAVAGAFRPLG